MKLAEVVETSRRVSDTRKRLEKVALLADCLRRMGPDELSAGVSLLAGELPHGRVGIGYAALYTHGSAPPVLEPTLTVGDVARHLDDVASMKGVGSAARRETGLAAMMSHATAEEQEYLQRLLVGGLRQGALESIVLDAIAKAWSVPVDSVRRARMFAPDLGGVARAASDGAAALEAFSIKLFTPVMPMLAQPADGVEDALTRLGTASLELKVDGARIQVHRSGDDVRIYSRELNDVTAALPEVVAAVQSMAGRDVIVDGEVVAVRPDGSPQPFQTTMRRFGRKQHDEALVRELPLRPYFFDCLYLDGRSLLELGTGGRFEALSAAATTALMIPRIITASPVEAHAFLADAWRQGHEGVMAKSLEGPYEAGRRGQNWLKIKKVHTLDLVVLAVEWGSGRRKGLLSNIHLGARDPVNGGFVMLGKTFKGMTDEMLKWQTERFLALELGREGHVVHLRPEQVVEVAFSDVQVSQTYRGGMALRLARVKRYRPDKTAASADTVDTVRALLPRP